MKDFYSTKDFYISVVLLSFGYVIDYIEVDSHTHIAIFSFSYSEELQEIINKYWKKELRVEPQSFIHAYRTLKNRLKEESR